MKTFIPALVLLAAVCGARGELTFQTVEYKENATHNTKAGERSQESTKVFFAEIFK